MVNLTSIFQTVNLNVSEPSTFVMSTFNETKATKIILHGFIDTGYVPWVAVSINLSEIGIFVFSLKLFFCRNYPRPFSPTTT
jgi:hypothetical protein